MKTIFTGIGGFSKLSEEPPASEYPKQILLKREIFERRDPGCSQSNQKYSMKTGQPGLFPEDIGGL